MNSNKILQIIQEELNHQEGLLFEGMLYTRGDGYRNNQLLEIYDSNGKLLLTEGVIDDVQSVLDYAGFIPGIGDALDAVNAIIYMVRKKWVMGALSLVAVIPVVGSVIATPFKALHKLIGKQLGKVFGLMTTNGKVASSTLFNIAKKMGGKVQGLIKKIYGIISKNVNKINSFLDKIIPSFAKLVDKASFGFVGLPLAFTKAGDVMIKQMKEFFSGIAKASSYKTSKSIAKSEVKDEVKNLTNKEKKQYENTYKKADKKKYPTLTTFIDSQMKYKQSQNKT
mgnify:FL=1|tara:strand:+ start:653 stop:1495 length:843 start_codon:yes stop_codon:yes gene_type:complete